MVTFRKNSYNLTQKNYFLKNMTLILSNVYPDPQVTLIF